MTEAQAKISTFVMHHDRCKPAEWTLGVWNALEKFASTGDLSYAAALSRHGLQLVTSEKHEPAGGTLELIGWTAEESIKRIVDEDYGDLCEDDVTAVVPVYRGPTKYVAAYSIGDEEGFVEGREYEIKDSEAEASAYIRSISTTETAS